MNLVQIISKLLENKGLIEKIAAMLGLDRDLVDKAVGAAIPTILAGITGAASKPGGATKLAEVVAKQDPGLLDNLGSLVAGGDTAASHGGGILGNLLGEDGLGKIGGVLSRFTGVNEGGMGKLLGLLGPIVMGVVAKESKGMDAGSLVSLIADQKKNIASAMPAGLGDMIGSAVPGLNQLFSDTGDAAASVAGAVKDGNRQVAHAVESAKPSGMKWLLPLILLILAALLLPKMCQRASEGVDQVKRGVEASTDSAKLVSDASDLLKGATGTIASITDEASADAALPKLRDLGTKIGGLKGMMAQLPPVARGPVYDALRPLITKLREVASPVLAMPVVGGKVKPLIDSLFSQLDELVPPA